MRAISLLPLIAASALAFAQSNPPAAPPIWQMQDSGTTAGLRGIDSVDGTVAWASGTGGTVLKTLDGGAHWTQCATPDAAKDGATLDFRGVQAWNAMRAVVLASGPGDKSRLYKTTDGCGTWNLILRNSEKDGFWDSIYFDLTAGGTGRRSTGFILGDPVSGHFLLLESRDFGLEWVKQRGIGLEADQANQGAFAASNSSFFDPGWAPVFGSGGTAGAFVYRRVKSSVCVDECDPGNMNLDGKDDRWERVPVPLGKNSQSSGVFAIRQKVRIAYNPPFEVLPLIAVGGDYTKPNESTGTAAWSADGGEHWTASITPPHGYRSAVQWSETLKLWITVGTNGSDISRDDGKTWQPLDDGNWNALSLPFVVGPNGRIARLNPAALPASK
jgi:photosystem II stability/assembly factor-like uncharacterized protein